MDCGVAHGQISAQEEDWLQRPRSEGRGGPGGEQEKLAGAHPIGSGSLKLRVGLHFKVRGKFLGKAWCALTQVYALRSMHLQIGWGGAWWAELAAPRQLGRVAEDGCGLGDMDKELYG